MKTAGSMRPSAVVTSDTWVARPERPAASTASASKPGMTTSGVAVTSARVTTASPPMWARGRQASHVWRPGSTPKRRDVARADASTASWVRTTPLGCPAVPERRHDEGVAVVHGHPVGQRVLLAVGADDPGRAKRLEHGAAGRGGEARVEWCGRVPGVPDGP